MLLKIKELLESKEVPNEIKVRTKIFMVFIKNSCRAKVV